MRISDLKNALFVFLLGCALSITVKADTAYFDGKTMHVPELLVFQDEIPRLLQRVELQMQKPGRFEMVSSSEFDYALVQGISSDAEIVRGDPLVIHISGFKAVDCVSLNPVSVVRLGNSIHLVVTEKPVPANVRCTTGSHSFLIGTTIDSAVLEPGAYDIYAHGLHIEVMVKDENAG